MLELQNVSIENDRSLLKLWIFDSRHPILKLLPYSSTVRQGRVLGHVPLALMKCGYPSQQLPTRVELCHSNLQNNQQMHTCFHITD